MCQWYSPGMFSWSALPRPFFALAPMEDVTDTVFRQIVAALARPDVFFTEFMSVEGFYSSGHDAVAPRLTYSAAEHPVIAQVWGTTPELFRKIAVEVSDRGFDGLDINMGCPQKDIMKTGGGARLIDTPDLAGEIIRSARQGIRESGRQIPLSVKTRIGTKQVKTEQWISFLLKQELDALTIHCRTAKDMSKVPARWEEIGQAAEIRKSLKPDTVLIGNGDVLSRTQGTELAARYGIEGIMIGRGIFQDPWIFAKDEKNHTGEERIGLFRKHLELYLRIWNGRKPFAIMKKFAKMYINGFPNASEVRQHIMDCTTAEEAQLILSDISADWT